MHVDEVAAMATHCKYSTHGDMISGGIMVDGVCLCLVTRLCQEKEKIIMADGLVNLEEFLVASCLGV